MAQLGARLTGGQEAVSSSLATRTILKKAEIVDIQRFQLFAFLQKASNGPCLVLITKTMKAGKPLVSRPPGFLRGSYRAFFMSDFCPINNHKADLYQKEDIARK